MSTRKQRRIRLIIIGIALLAVAATAIGFGFKNSIEYFKSPTQIAEEGTPTDGLFRVGGLVKESTVIHKEGDVVEFIVTDGNSDISVSYTGLLPDLFSEGQGAIARGRLIDDIFVAEEILAKHDETYMPREVVDALKEQGVYQQE